MHKHILIVEDNTFAALELQDMLHNLGYTDVYITKNYTQAMQRYTSNTPDLLLLDIDLEEEKNGIDIANEIRKIDDTLPIIFLTADSDEETIKKASFASPSNYINKPFEKHTLKTAILLALYSQETKALTSSILCTLTNKYTYAKTSHKLYYQKQPIHLSLNENTLVEIFSQYPKQIIAPATLQELIWKEEPPIAENALRTLIYRLNKKLPSKLIIHVSMQGYKLNQ